MGERSSLVNDVGKTGQLHAKAELFSHTMPKNKVEMD